MIPISVSLSHYKRSDVQKEIIANSKDREVAIRFGDTFGKRPDMLRHASDVMELAKQGATSFHASEELWKDPLQLDPSMRRQELDNLRIGWDLVIDIDCGIFEYSKVAADLVVKALRFHKVRSVSCKFSGNKGFHIGVPYEAFPEKIRNEDTKSLFPDAPRKIALYVKHMILPEFGNEIIKLEGGEFGIILEKTGKKEAEVVYIEKGQKKFNPESILQMDTLLISPRHLYRMPYSLHEKSGLVSTPLNPDKVMLFRKEFALPDTMKISPHRFLDRANAESGEAKQLLTEALDFGMKREITEQRQDKEFEAPKTALPEELFPPCIKTILNGMEDGRKRALFVLVNYFTSIGWDYEMIEKKLKEWNAKNREPLREVNLLGHLRYHRQQQKKIPPPNCPKRENGIPLINQQNYYTDLRVCSPDSFCAKIKNPAQYTSKKAWMIENGNKGKGKKKESDKNAEDGKKEQN